MALHGAGGGQLLGGPEHGLVEVRALQRAAHRDVAVEGEVDGLGQEVAQLVPEPGVPPLHHGAVLQQVLEVGVDGHLVLAHVLQLHEHHLGVVVHDAGDEGRADLGPLQREVCAAEHHECARAALHGHGHGVVHGGGGGEVALVQAQPVAGVPVLEVGGEPLLHEVSVGHGVAAIMGFSFIVIGPECSTHLIKTSKSLSLLE